MKIKNIIILGGTGFVGTKIFKKLKKKYSVKNLSYSKGTDLRKENSIKKYLKKNKTDLIINCAAHVGGLNYIKKKKADIASDNLKIYLNLYLNLKKLKNKPKVINLISNCVYPGHHKLQKEREIFNGEIHESVDPFGLPKLVLMKISRFYFEQYNIKSLNLILPNAYGPGDHLDTERSHALNGIIVRMIKDQKKKKLNFEVWGSGKPKREWIFAEDIAKLISNLLNKQINYNYENLNVAQNKSYSVNHIAKLVKEALKYKGTFYNNKKFIDGAFLKQLDNKNFKKRFRNFKFTNFKKGIIQTVNYYKRHI